MKHLPKQAVKPYERLCNIAESSAFSDDIQKRAQIAVITIRKSCEDVGLFLLAYQITDEALENMLALGIPFEEKAIYLEMQRNILKMTRAAYKGIRDATKKDKQAKKSRSKGASCADRVSGGSSVGGETDPRIDASSGLS